MWTLALFTEHQAPLVFKSHQLHQISFASARVSHFAGSLLMTQITPPGEPCIGRGRQSCTEKKSISGTNQHQ